MPCRIITWNVACNVPGPFRYGAYERSKKIGAALYASLGSDFDILCLQELIVYRSKILKALVRHPYATPVLRPSFASKNIRLVTGGLCIVSKYPILECKALVFRGPAYHVERACAKGVLYAKIHIPNLGPVHILNTHLNAWTGPRAESARTHQIQEIADWIQNDLKPDRRYPLICAGDWNIDFNQYYDTVFDWRQTLRMEIPMPPQTSFSFDPATNVLVGLDDPSEYKTQAQKRGCLDTYLVTGRCDCCPRQLLDAFMVSTDHGNLNNANVQVHAIRTREVFDIQVRFGVWQQVYDTSDHAAVSLQCDWNPNVEPCTGRHTNHIEYADADRFCWTWCLVEIFLVVFYVFLLWLIIWVLRWLVQKIHSVFRPSPTSQK